jgi:uncharacterized membrane protein YphA (DoxX/SURF4 family)
LSKNRPWVETWGYDDSNFYRFLVPVAFIMHNFWAVQDPQMKMVEMVNFTKNLALAASALMFLAIPQPWPFSLGG